MKEELILPNKVVFAIIILFVIATLVNFLFIFQKENDYKTRISRGVKGVITDLKDEGNDSFCIEVLQDGTIIKQHNKHFAWYIQKYKISKGDSLSKEPQSKVMTFFKRESGVFKMICTYEIKGGNYYSIPKYSFAFGDIYQEYLPLRLTLV